MSMISELIEELREQSRYNRKIVDSVYDIFYENAKFLRIAADTIEELSGKLHVANMGRSSAFYNGGWIPCDEREPEENGDYLVTFKDGSVYATSYCDKAFFVLSDVWAAPAEVVAWRPLPEPYKEV